MNKIKNMLVSMGAITTLVVPVVLAVSCGDVKEEAQKPVDQTVDTNPETPVQTQEGTGSTVNTDQSTDQQGSTPVSHPVIDGLKNTIGTVVAEIQRVSSIEDQELRKQAIITDVKNVAPIVFDTVIKISHTELADNLITNNVESISNVVISLRDKLTELLKTIPVINGLIFEKEVDAEGNVILDADGNPHFVNVKVDTTGIDKVNGIINSIVGTEDNIFTKFNNLLDALLADAKFILEDANVVTLARLNELYYGRVSVEEIYKASPEIQTLVSDVTGVMEFVKSKDFTKTISTLRSLVSNPREFVGVNSEFIAHEIFVLRGKLEVFIATKLSMIDELATTAIGNLLPNGFAGNAARAVLSRQSFSQMIYSDGNFHRISQSVINSVANSAISGVLQSHESISSILGDDPLNTVIDMLHEVFDTLNEDDINELLTIFAEHRSIDDFFASNRHATFKTNVLDVLNRAIEALHPQVDETTTPE